MKRIVQKLFLQMLCFLAPLHLVASVGNAAPTISEMAKWDRLVSKMITEGQILSTEFGEYRVLSEVQPPDKSVERVASYISAVVYPFGEEIFLDRVESVWEDWKIDNEKNFRVDQWLFRFNPEGELISQSRSVLKLSPTGSILGRDFPETTADEFLHKWEDILASWYGKL